MTDARKIIKKLREIYDAERELRDACVDGDPDIKARAASLATARDCLLSAMDVLLEGSTP
jgi:hypothetical protein